MVESTRDWGTRLDAVVATLVTEKFIPPAMPIERRQLLIASMAAALALDTYEPAQETGQVSIEDIYADPAASFWLRECLAAAITRDPIDAANDAEMLSRVLTQRAKTLLAGAPRVLGDE